MDAAQVEELMFAYQHPYMAYNSTTRECDTPALAPWDSWDAWSKMKRHDPVPVPNLGLVSIVESFGGEGQGDQYYLVFKVEFESGGVVWDTRYYRVDGYYSSYGGGEYDGPFYEVQPVQRMVTFYEKAE